MAKRTSSRSRANDAGLATPPQSKILSPTEEDIRLRAYHRYLERGGGHGMDFEDWVEAERELKKLTAEV